jgi:hypothetical protein
MELIHERPPKRLSGGNREKHDARPMPVTIVARRNEEITDMGPVSGLMGRQTNCLDAGDHLPAINSQWSTTALPNHRCGGSAGFA